MGLIITLLLLSKKRDDKQVQLYIVTQFFLTLLSLAAALSASSLDSSIWLIWSAVNITSSLFATTTLSHFSFYILKGDNSFWGNRKLLVIYIIPIFFSLVWLIDPYIIYPDIIKIEIALFGIFWSRGTPISVFLLLTFYIYLGVMVLLAVQNFYRMFRQTEDLELRRRAAYFVLSSLVPGIALTITLGLQLLVENYVPKLEMAIVSLSIAGAIIAYGILKDQLYDLDVIVSKSVKYTLMNIVLAWVFMISRELLIPIVSSTFFSGNELAFILAGFVVVTVFVPIKNTTSKFSAKLLSSVIYQSPTTKNLQFYQSHLQCMAVDGKITEKEHDLLTRLRSFLEISEADHVRLEQEVLGDLDQNSS